MRDLLRDVDGGDGVMSVNVFLVSYGIFYGVLAIIFTYEMIQMREQTRRLMSLADLVDELRVVIDENSA